jgi:hypothetical protein
MAALVMASSPAPAGAERAIPQAQAAAPGAPALAATFDDNDVLQWNTLALQAVRQSKLGAPLVSRALAILHTCMFDAAAAYHDRAVATASGGRGRRPPVERTLSNRRIAISEAAYVAFAELFPHHRRFADEQMARRGLTPRARAAYLTPSDVGRAACAAVLRARHRDGANQLGDENGGAPYSDYTRYRPTNTLVRLSDQRHWQPVASSNLGPSAFLVPHWGRVTPFAFRLSSSSRPPAPPLPPSARFAAEEAAVLAMSAGLTDEHKVIVEYWMDGPRSETPPGHWNLFAQGVSRRDGHDLDRDVAMFFVLNNALLDAGIAAWDSKRHFDSVRPITALRQTYAGQRVQAWGGPGRGTREIDGRDWLPYQRANFITPPFPEYVSGHSTFSAAAAEILKRVTGSDDFGGSVTVAPRSSSIEPGITPRVAVTLSWATFTDAAVQAGLSRRYGGIHFESADIEGQRLGRAVADRVWRRAQELQGRPAS